MINRQENMLTLHEQSEKTNKTSSLHLTGKILNPSVSSGEKLRTLKKKNNSELFSGSVTFYGQFGEQILLSNRI